MKPLFGSRVDRTPFLSLFAAYCYNIIVGIPRFIQIKSTLRLFPGDIYSFLFKNLNNQRIQRTGFKPRAFYIKDISAVLSDIFLSHLASGTVMHTDNEDFFFNHLSPSIVEQILITRA